MIRTQLHKYQERASRFIEKQKRSALFLDLGLGKTVITLTAISDLIHGMMVNKVLIIAPLRVANSVWWQEGRNWEHLNHLRFSLLTGSTKQRISGLHRQADVYVINRENVYWLVTQLGKQWDFDMVVIDESSSIKNPTAKRFKALKYILPYTSHFVLLSGTPSPNGLLDLWSQIFCLDYGKALGKTFTQFKARYFDSDWNGYKYIPRAGAAKQIHDAVAPMCLSMAAADYLDMPDRIDIIYSVDLPADAMRKYHELEREMIIELGEETITAVNAAVLVGKLLQMANGHIYTDELKNFEEVHSAKLDALEDIVESSLSENILVAYNFKADAKRIVERFPDAVVMDKDPETIERWNRKEIKMLLIHPMSAGEGLNLQRGGNIMVWFSLTWNMGSVVQACGRLHRQGQENAVRIIWLVAKDTADEIVIKSLDSKSNIQLELLQAVKEKY